MSEWQDIKTAPRDGSVIVIPISLRWKAYKQEARKQGYPAGRWQCHNGFGWENFNGEPTHWMPKPPTTDGE